MASISGGIGAPVRWRNVVFASGWPDRGCSGRSMSRAIITASEPRRDAIVAPDALICCQKRDSENLPEMTARSPITNVPTTHIWMAL